MPSSKPTQNLILAHQNCNPNQPTKGVVVRANLNTGLNSISNSIKTNMQINRHLGKGGCSTFTLEVGIQKGKSKKLVFIIALSGN